MHQKFYSVDQFGVRNYKARYLALASIGGLYTLIAILAAVLLAFEHQAQGANIVEYSDAFWTLQMSASTIGFGDYYPVTFEGRVVVTLMFYLGVALVGFIGAIIAERLFGFTDTNVKNRELRLQNEKILAQSNVLEQKVNSIIERMDQLNK